MIHLSVRADIRQLQRTLDNFAKEQVPFAAAQALTSLARKVQVAEKAMLREQLKDPLPFTVNSVRVKPARKDDLRATVYVQDITAAYLQPFILGGKHKLVGKGVTWLNPKHIKLNAYGNIAAGTLARLKARSDIFIGKVKTKAGVVNGIWQRPKASRGKLRAGKRSRLGLRVEAGDTLHEMKMKAGVRCDCATGDHRHHALIPPLPVEESWSDFDPELETANCADPELGNIQSEEPDQPF